MSDVPDERGTARRRRGELPPGYIKVSYRTDVTSENRSVLLRLADLSAADRRLLSRGIAESERRYKMQRVYSSFVVAIGGERYRASPDHAPSLFAFARRALGGPGTFGNDPGW